MRRGDGERAFLSDNQGLLASQSLRCVLKESAPRISNSEIPRLEPHLSLRKQTTEKFLTANFHDFLFCRFSALVAASPRHGARRSWPRYSRREAKEEISHSASRAGVSTVAKTYGSNASHSTVNALFSDCETQRRNSRTVKQKLKLRQRKQSSRPASAQPAASRRRAASSESTEIVPLTICMVATDLTELAEANDALRSNEQSLRLLSTRLLKVQDDERRRIARDLHDITGQKLAFQSIALSQILNRKSSGLDPESRRALLECSALSKQVGDEIRTLSYLLHPPLLDELGLSSAVKWYVEGFEHRSGIKVNVEIDSDFVRLSPDVEVTLFRVIQESLTNVHRYSASPNAFVRLKATSNEIELQIGDSGKGMSQDTLDAKTGKVVPLGVGIQGMRERIRQLAGKLEITSQPNQGTLVKATLPLSTAQASEESAVSPALLSPTHASAPSSAHRTSRKQILIADDHEMLRRGLRSMLEKELAWEICGEAVDGQDAVDKAAELHPDLVILDINMPVLNGLAAVRQIRRNSPGTKILIFTVHDSDQTVKEIQAAGAHGILSKSNASEDLLRVVKELLASKQASSAAARSAAS